MWLPSKVTGSGKAILWLLKNDTMGWTADNLVWYHLETQIAVDISGFRVMAWTGKNCMPYEVLAKDKLTLSHNDRVKIFWAAFAQRRKKRRVIAREQLKAAMAGGPAVAAVFKWAITNGHMKKGLPEPEQPPDFNP